MRAVAVLRIFVLDWHIEQRISGMVDGNIGFSIFDISSCSVISSPSALIAIRDILPRDPK